MLFSDELLSSQFRFPLDSNPFLSRSTMSGNDKSFENISNFTAFISLGRRSLQNITIFQPRRFSYSSIFFLSLIASLYKSSTSFFIIFSELERQYFLFFPVSVIFRVHASKRFHSKLLTERRAEIFLYYFISNIFLYTLNLLYICKHRRTLPPRSEEK